MTSSMPNFARRVFSCAALFVFGACGGVAENDPSSGETEDSAVGGKGKGQGQVKSGDEDPSGGKWDAGEGVGGGSVPPSDPEVSYENVAANCADACLEYFECGGVPDDFACGCEEALIDAKIAGCLGALDRLLDCWRSDLCADLIEICEDEVFEYLDCDGRKAMPIPPPAEPDYSFEDLFFECYAACHHVVTCGAGDPQQCDENCMEVATTASMQECGGEFVQYTQCVLSQDACAPSGGTCPDEMYAYGDCAGSVQ